jgi:hypothetical protein
VAENAETAPQLNAPSTPPVDWLGLPRYLLPYMVIMLIGTSVLYYVFITATLQFASTLIPAGPTGRLMGGILANVQRQLVGAGLMGMITSNVSVVISGVFSMLAILILTHMLMIFLLRGNGTIPNQWAALLRVYNRWLPFQYALLVAACFLAFGSIPESLLWFVPGVILALIVGAKIPAQIGRVYGVSTRRGCFAYIASLIVFSVITGGFFALLLSALLFALNYRFGS